MDITEILTRIYPLPSSSVQRLCQCLVRVSYPKGHFVVQADTLEPDVYFIDKGIACAYIKIRGEKMTFWIGTEGSTLVSLRSYVTGEKGYETIELMEDSVLYKLSKADLEHLYQEDLHIANWGRKFAEIEFLRTEERLINISFSSAAERYERLLSHQPELLQRIALKTLASYLGITPVSLSRIRAGLGKQER